MNALSAIVVALALATSPAEYPCETDTCDLCELNHYHDENGLHLLSQLIFYDWSERDGRHQVAAWRLLKDESRRPRRCDDGYETRWTEGGRQLRVVAKQYRETWTQWDVELVERKHLPREERRELFTKPKADDPMPPAMEER
jgi:hypothetical protein